MATNCKSVSRKKEEVVSNLIFTLKSTESLFLSVVIGHFADLHVMLIWWILAHFKFLTQVSPCSFVQYSYNIHYSTEPAL
jgi:hypothetical protein